VTEKWDVPLMVSRGYASLSFLYGAASYIATLDRPAFLYHFGDYDPSGQDAAAKIESTLRELAPNADITFKQVAVLPQQIEVGRLPSRPTKTTDTRTKNWTGGESVELDAIKANVLRRLCESHIQKHVDQHQYRMLQVAEQNERELLAQWRSVVAGSARA
jgi:hypothetical protein